MKNSNCYIMHTFIRGLGLELKNGDGRNSGCRKSDGLPVVIRAHETNEWLQVNSLNLLNLCNIKDKPFPYKFLIYAKNKRSMCTDDYNRLAELIFAGVQTIARLDINSLVSIVYSRVRHHY